MKTNQDWNLDALDWKRIGLSLGVGVIMMLAMTGLAAWLMDGELVARAWGRYLAALILVSSSLIGALTARGRDNPWIGPAAVGAGLWLILLAINAICYGGDLSGALPTALAILGGCGAGALLGRGTRRRSHPRRKYRHR